MDEYAGKKMEAQVLPGGIKIAGIEQNDLEYDPALYGRDRGELDWDRMSIHSSHMLNDAGSFVRDKMSVPINRIQGYLHHGPMSSISKRGPEHIELGRIDTRSDAWPLLHANSSTASGIETPYEGMHQYPPGVPYDTQRSMTPGGSRPMTPLGQSMTAQQTRPMTPQGGHMQSASGNWAGHAQSPSGNWAGHSQSPSGNWSAGGSQQRNAPGQPFVPPQAPTLSQPIPPNPHARGRSFDALNAPSAYQQPPQHGYGGPSAGSMYHDRTPSANSETRPGDYFTPQRVASPQQSPGGLMGGRASPMQRLGTPQQQYQQYQQQPYGQGLSPQRGPSRQPSFDQLRQHQQPSPGGQYQQQPPGGFPPQGPYRR